MSNWINLLCRCHTVALLPPTHASFLRWRSFLAHRQSTMRRRRRGNTTGGRGWESLRMFSQPVLEPWLCTVCTWVSLIGEDIEMDTETGRVAEALICSFHSIFICVYKWCVCVCATGLLQMQLILHYDMTYREVKYSNLGLEDIDRKMLMGINVTPIIGLLYTPILIR